MHPQRLLKHEQVLLAPIARQGTHDVARAGLDAPVTGLRPLLRVTLTGHDVADDLGQREVHLHPRLRHALYLTGLLREQRLARAPPPG